MSSSSPDPPGSLRSGLLPEIASYIDENLKTFESLPPDRKALLRKLAEYLGTRLRSAEEARLLFICTHNSRRSHLAQIWARVAAVYLDLPQITTFSGGTEATAFNPRAVSALERAGFRIEKGSTLGNPVYRVRFHVGLDPLVCFSKLYDQEPNPRDDFCAIMTCSEADEACPAVPGASRRIALPYEDPKAFDGTAEEATGYDKRCRQICGEMLYSLSLVERGY